MPKPLAPACVLLAAVLPAQQPAPAPFLHASEAAGLRLLQRWVAGPADEPPAYAPLPLGYDVHALGFTRRGEEHVGAVARLDPEATSVLLLVPVSDAYRPLRPMFANRAGRIFVGTFPAERAPTWRPSPATLVGSGERLHLNDMLLESGTARDGTVWRRIDDLPELQPRPVRVRLQSRDGTRLEEPLVEIGMGRHEWHPAWVPLRDAPAVSLRAVARVTGDRAELVAEGRGVPIAAPSLFVSGLRLRESDVRIVKGEIVVDYDASMLVEAEGEEAWWNDQAWAARGLRLMAAAQLAARAERRFDRDRDGRGEFGAIPSVLTNDERSRVVVLENDRLLFRGHLFELHLSANPDVAEERFVAFAWPARAHGVGDLVFVVDQTGVVRAAPAHDRFVGHEAAPGPGDLTALPWRPLR